MKQLFSGKYFKAIRSVVVSVSISKDFEGFLAILSSITPRGVSRIFIMGFPSVRNYRNIFRITSDQLLTI